MEEDLMKIGGGSVFGTALIFLIKFMFDYLRKNDAVTDGTIQGQEAKNEIVDLLRKEIGLLREELAVNRKEMDLYRKKIIILEQLAINSGIDVIGEYKRQGIEGYKE